jgi:hypothetical protein
MLRLTEGHAADDEDVGDFVARAVAGVKLTDVMERLGRAANFLAQLFNGSPISSWRTLYQGHDQATRLERVL